MSFYYIESQDGEAISRIKRIYPCYLLKDGSMMVYAPYYSIIPAEFRCGLGEPGQIVHESQDAELERWYQGLSQMIRREIRRKTLGRGRLE